MTHLKSLVAVLALVGAAVAAPQGDAPKLETPIMVAPADIHFAPAPPSLPAGAQAALLAGDPSKAGPFTLRVKLPADYKVPPHFHPDVETVTVLSGTFHAATGDSFDPAKCKAMPAGSFVALPGKVPHFVFTKEETVIQVNATGPWSLTYVNPADDPRNKK